jgi:hypothetical protein
MVELLVLVGLRVQVEQLLNHEDLDEPHHCLDI